MQLPRPDLTIFLYMPLEISMQLKKDQLKDDLDGLENNISHLRNAQEAYLQLSEMYGWQRIDCEPFINPENPNKSIKEIFDLIYSIVTEKFFHN